MELQTVVKLDQPMFQVDYSTRLMMLGSCFVENIGAKLAYFKFNMEVNPCGIVYNPMSVADTLDLLLSNKKFTKEDLYRNNNQWVSLSHHGQFSDPDPEVCLQNINNRLEAAAAHLKKTDVLIITWGTAWVYRHQASGKIVSNCHKFPAADFERFRLKVEDIEKVYIDLFHRLRNFCPGIKILFTVSPIRHWKDGAHGNQLSKSVLLLAIERITHYFDQVSYFPSYEIVIDELRDYRFYAEDMLHISSQGIEYIWEKFQSAYMNLETREWMKRIDKINKTLLHHPTDPNSPAYQELIQKMVQEKDQIARQLNISFK